MPPLLRLLERCVLMSLLAMQRRRLQRTQNRVVLYSLRGRRSCVAIPSAQSLACEIVRRGGRGHMRDCGTGDGRGLPEDTGRARVGQLRGCQIHGSRPLATRDPRALRGRDASDRRGERFGTPAQCDQHASLARGGPGSLRGRRREAYYYGDDERLPFSDCGPGGNERKDIETLVPQRYLGGCPVTSQGLPLSPPRTHGPGREVSISFAFVWRHVRV